MTLATGLSADLTTAGLRRRVVDYIRLTKPRIAVMVLVTVAAGYFAASGWQARLGPLFHVLLGTFLVAGAASAWNMYLERAADARMRRTMHRPIPSGRLHPLEVVAFGTALAVTGLNYLFHALPTIWPMLLAAFTFLSYVAIYTPLKSVTVWNTVIGAIPGAMPPLIGWTAAGQPLTLEAWTLFGILLVWQLPHFMSIAWLYRHDYARAGLCMVSVADPDGRRTARSMVGWCVLLVLGSMVPLLSRWDRAYAFGAAILGIWFLSSTWQFHRLRSDGAARRVLRRSLAYLPLMMALVLLSALSAGCVVDPQFASPPSNDLSIPVPEFQLTERSGRVIKSDDLRGKVWIASFVFVRCPGPCPQVTATMARLQREFDAQSHPDLRLVTFTVDPQRDNPRELRDYAERYQAHPERWLFLTGQSEDELHRLIRDGFKLGVQRSANPQEEFDHSTRLVVVDKRGMIRGYFDGIASSSAAGREEFETNLERLKALVKRLERE